jgi:hypothetical protein
LIGPTQALIELLAEQRRAGADFPEARAFAVPIVISTIEDIHNTDEVQNWLTAFESTRYAWEASFCRSTTSRRERALSLLADDSDREPFAGTCSRCAEPLPPAKRVGAPRMYCGDRCRKLAHRERGADRPALAA